MEAVLDRFFELAARKGLRVAETGSTHHPGRVASHYFASMGILAPEQFITFLARYDGFKLFLPSGAEYEIGGHWYAAPFSRLKDIFEFHHDNAEAMSGREFEEINNLPDFFPILTDFFGGFLCFDISGKEGQVLFAHSVDYDPTPIFSSFASAMDCFTFAVEKELFFDDTAAAFLPDFERYAAYCREMNAGMEYWK